MDSGNFPDNAMDKIALLEVVKVIERAKREVKPTIIYTHSAADLNIDHRIVSQATLTAFRPQPGEVWKEIRAFEVSSATDYGHPDVTSLFQPNLIISIENTWPKKLAALQQYKDEMRDAPHSRSFDGVEVLARYRGNQVGLKYAEAFQILRKIER
jgi:LmbE family N-acetylglucosaminyl deacetylase